MAKVILSHNFKREAKPLLKKYASLRQELGTLIQKLSEEPTKGTRLLCLTFARQRLNSIKSSFRGDRFAQSSLFVVNHSPAPSDALD